MLTQRQLNRALLARQLLLERARAPVPVVLERLGGLQAQYAPSMYIGLWSRTQGFAREDLTRLLERRAVVQATLMRATIHLVARDDFWPFALATREARRELLVRAHRGGLDPTAMAAAAERVRERLASGHLRRADLEELLGKPQASAIGLWIDLVRVPPSGTWERRRADLYAAAEDWIGPPAVTPEDGVVHLVSRYLAAFGPASRANVAVYTGLGQPAIAPALERVAPRRFRGPSGEELLDVEDGPLPHPETPAPVRFLPTWDATLLVHARRTGILPEEHRARIFTTRNPHSESTFLVDGVVAGTWRYVKGRIELSPFAPLARAAQRELREEGDRLAELHA